HTTAQSSQQLRIMLNLCLEHLHVRRVLDGLVQVDIGVCARQGGLLQIIMQALVLDRYSALRTEATDALRKRRKIEMSYIGG
ncbi:MAG: hypothetical protein EBX69_08975, partial [Betaproteobacteria bacterium]|nr:hypothetical protein [Betaproteobacteria bacterium]